MATKTAKKAPAKKKAAARRPAKKKLMMKAKGKAKPKAKAAPKPKKKIKAKARVKAANRRQYKRFAVTNIWVRELSGDYQFVAPAADISEGGVFLEGRIKTSSEACQLTLHLGKEGSLEVTARPVHDRVLPNSCGTGYVFNTLSAQQSKTLKNFLRNLD